jgi:TolB-like protein
VRTSSVWLVVALLVCGAGEAAAGKRKKARPPEPVAPPPAASFPVAPPVPAPEPASPPPAARPKDPRPSIAIFEFTGKDVDPEIAKSLVSIAASEVSGTGAFSVLTTDDIRSMLMLEQTRQMLDCSESSCFAEIGSALGVSRLLTGGITRTGAGLVLSVQLVDPNEGRVLGRESREVSDPSELGAATRALTRAVIAPLLADRQGLLTVHTNELGANVFIDDRLIGIAPLPQQKAAVGRHTVRLTKPGFVDVVQDVSIERDQVARVDGTLVPSPDFITAYEQRASLFRWGAWGAGVLGLGLAGSGAYLAVNAHNESSALAEEVRAYNADPRDLATGKDLDARRDRLNERYQLGQVLLVSGVIFGAAALVLVAIGDAPERYEGYRAEPSAGGD